MIPPRFRLFSMVQNVWRVQRSFKQERNFAMPQYVLKVLIDLEARDDIDARKIVGEFVKQHIQPASGVREIVLHAKDDNKSIRVNPDGTFPGNWNKGGPGQGPGVRG